MNGTSASVVSRSSKTLVRSCSGNSFATLRVVPQVDLEIVKERDGLERLVEVTSATSMIAQHTPALEPGDRVLDSRSPSSMSPPDTIADDSPAPKPRDLEVGHTSVATVREDATMVLASRFED
ncbi:MAG: hypothetical protein ABIY55_23100 [Kofleriaceae bacterium]